MSFWKHNARLQCYFRYFSIGNRPWFRPRWVAAVLAKNKHCFSENTDFHYTQWHHRKGDKNRSGKYRFRRSGGVAGAVSSQQEGHCFQTPGRLWRPELPPGAPDIWVNWQLWLSVGECGWLFVSLDVCRVYCGLHPKTAGMGSGTSDQECCKNSCRNQLDGGKLSNSLQKVNNCVAYPEGWIYLKTTIVQEPESQTASNNSPANWFDWSVTASSHDATEPLNRNNE